LYAGDKPVNKKLIIMIAAAGLVSFTGTFILAWLTKKTAPQDQSHQISGPTLTGQKTELKVPQSETDTRVGSVIGSPSPSEGRGSQEAVKKAMTEKQLKNLVYEVREKINEYNNKLQDLERREQRLQGVQNTLKEDIEELNNLRIELASTIAGLKSERDKLNKSRIEIAETERDNLISIASAYDKMDAASAGKILTKMSQTENGSDNDAVKILHYMAERTKAKLLAELVTSEPALAACFCQKLKQIVER
jgi:chromosome segregation ATPase